jgi:putative membrane-bound dehydrogenase-like protein
MLRGWSWGVLLAGFASMAGAQDGALPPAEAAASLKLPPGFKATLFAAEPAIVQPMAFTFDDRGRLWVVECLSYPSWREDGTGRDRVTILEDTDGDGAHDKRTVFFDKGANLSGIEVGFGGVWLTAVPNLIFIPDKNGDDRPDGPPKVLLDGWDLKARHNVVGNLAWGPDGWLYGCNGILSNSLLGKPGTPPARRVAMNCGVWRYHPLRHEFEAYAHGTTNPWGLDWNEHGQMFITNCVIKHIFHVVPGAHFERMFGQDVNPHSYGLLQSCADHQHWAGGHWTSSRAAPTANYAAHSDAGGGHAHSGCMIYLGDNWPAEYRGNAFLVNIHGQRLNRDVLEREGSGYVARHAEDFAQSQDPWFRGLHCKYGSDGGVYVSDWSDTGECHDNKEEECDKTGGRIFKIVYEGTVGNALCGVPGTAQRPSPTDRELVNLQFHASDWHARHARRQLQERAAVRKLDAPAIERLTNIARGGRPDDVELGVSQPTASLRALWTLHVTGLLHEENLLLPLLANPPDEYACAWAILLAAESKTPSEKVRGLFTRLAKTEDSPLVRLHLAAALQRIPLPQRWPIAEALLSHGEDTTDAYLPLMYWYAVEPLVPRQTRKAIELLPQVKIPLVRQYLTRRIVAVYEGDEQPDASKAWIMAELLRTLRSAGDPDVQLDILIGLREVYRGRRGLKPPAEWRETYGTVLQPDERIIRELRGLAVLFGDQVVIDKLRSEVHGLRQLTLAERRQALELLHAARDPGLAKLLPGLIHDPELRGDAIRALAAYDLSETPAALLSIYPQLLPAERQDAIQTLTARPAFALALLGAIEDGQIPRQDVSALVIRQLQALDDKAVNDRLTKVWGDIRPASAEKKERIAQLKAQLSAESLQQADLPHGRAIFAKTCANCHQLFDVGSKLGPELTGSQRHNLDYVLDNVLDPSAIVPRDYKVNILRLADGRVVQGVILAETPHTLTVQTANETIPVAVVDIEARKESPLSMMPEGLLDRLTARELRDLVAYLASPQQVPLPRAAPGSPR